jgi:hypothetical protein
MQLTDEQVALLNSIAEEWNQAEEDVKVAEQICNEIVIPAIKELRYAGRRVIDAIAKMHAGAATEEIEVLLREARFDCHRARHDAIDAGTSKIAIDLEIMVEKLGTEVILPVYPGFPALFKQLRDVRAKIRASRKDRNNRPAIYQVIESIDFPRFVDAFNEMRDSEDLMKGMAKRRRRSETIGVGGAALGILGLIFAFIFWYYPHEGASANSPSTVVRPDAPARHR